MRLVLESARRVAVHRTTTRAAWFPAEERVVVFCHSDPGAGIFDPDPAVTRAHKVRLLSVDRPGYGGSQPFAAATVASAADDLATVLDSIGVERAGVVGWSVGGLVGLALAARRPDLVDRVVVVATRAPRAEVPGIAEIPTDLHSPEALRLLGADSADDEALRADGVRERLGEMLRAAFLQGTRGLATDIAARCVRPWGFDPGAVQAKTLLLYGSRDRVADARHGRWFESRLPNAELDVVPGAGHLVVVPAWSRVLAHFASEQVEELSAA